MEPGYHNVIFLTVGLLSALSVTDLLKPHWKLRRREPKWLKEKLREARKNKDAETREWFSEQEIRDVRRRGAVGAVIGLILMFCLQPSVGWLGSPIKTTTTGDAELAERIRPELERIFRKRPIIGMTVVAVADGRETIIGLGRRDLNSDEPPDGRTLYEIGSISKTFTGILLAHEIRNSRANLNDPVNDHLPDGIRLPDSTNAPVLLRHLTTHRSGFPRRTEGMGGLFGTVFGRNGYEDFTADRFWRGGRSVSLQSAPGEKFHYSNFATALLGNLLASHQHGSFVEMYREVIGGPLGMEDTVIRLNEDQRSRWAQGYRSIIKLGSLTFALESDPMEIPEVLVGMGGFYSTGEDMLKYLKANAGLRESPVHESMRLSHQKLEDWRDEFALGMNWLRRSFEGHTFIWHNGRMSGHRCFIGFNESQPVAVAILSNSQVNLDWYGAHLLDLLSQPPAEPSK